MGRKGSSPSRQVFGDEDTRKEEGILLREDFHDFSTVVGMTRAISAHDETVILNFYRHCR